MDIDATQAIDLSDFDDDNDEKTDELERSPVGYLKVLSNRGFQETTFPVYEGENFIGRDATNSIAVPVKSLSKQHACIEVQADSHLLYDLGSRNKTRKAKLFLKPNVRYNIQHNDKIMLADMSCQYLFASEYEKSQKENDSGSDTDSELMLDGVDSPLTHLLPQLEDLKESENSDSPNLSDCIQPTQAANSNSRSHENETLQIKTPAAPKVGGVLAAESDDETPAKNGAADVSRVQESGSDTDVEAYANETEDFCIEGDDLAMAATQACNIQDIPTQPNNNAKATLNYDPDSDAESDNGTARGRSLYEAETQAAPGGVNESDEDDGDEEAAASKSLYEAETQVAQEDDDDDDDNTRGRSLYEAETQAAPGGGSENDSDDGDDEVRGRSLYEAETQAVPGGISGSDEDDDEGEDAMRGASLYEAATQALNFEDSDEEKSAKKRVSIASTVQLNISSDLESSGKKPRQSMSPTKTSLMKATKNKVRDISDELRENADVSEMAPLELKDIKVSQTDSEDTEIGKSEEIKNTPFEQFEESTEETLPCEDLDLEEPTQEMIDLEDQKNSSRQEQNEFGIKDHSIPLNEIHSKKSTDAGFGTEKEEKDILGGETSSRGHTEGDGSGEGKVASEKMGNVGSRSVAVESTLHYDLHRSQSDASKDSQEGIKNVDSVAAHTVPYQLVKSLTESSSGSREDTMETLLHPIESEGVEMSHEGDDGRESTEETQAYGEDDAEPLGGVEEGVDGVEEGVDKETAKGKLDDVQMDEYATQQYGEENEDMVPSTGDVGKTDQEVAMETDATQAYGEDDEDGVTETQVYGEDGGDTQVPDSQEGEQDVFRKEGDIQRDTIFAEEDVVAVDGGKLETRVEIDAAPQRRKSGDEGILKKRKGSIPSTSSDEKVGIISTLKKKVRFRRGNSESQSGVSIRSSRSSSRSSQSSVGSKDEEFEIITHDEVEEEVASSGDLSSISDEKPVRERRSSRKRKVATIEKPDEEEVKKIKEAVDEENEREKAEKDRSETETDGGRGGRKPSRKRKIATIDKPDLTELSSPELKSKDEDGVTQIDSSVRRSCRKETSKNEEEQEVEKDGNNNNPTKKRSGRSKVKTTEEKISEGEEVKGSSRQRKGKQSVTKNEVSSTRSTRRLQSQQTEESGDLVDNVSDNKRGSEGKKDIGTTLKVTSSDDSLGSTAKNNSRSSRGRTKKGEPATTDDKKKSIPNETERMEQVKVKEQVSVRESKRGRGKETGDTKEMSVDEEEEVPRTSRRGKRGGKVELDVPSRKVSKMEEPLEEKTENKEDEISKAEVEDTPQKGGRRGRNKKQEAVSTTPSSSRTRTRGQKQVKADKGGDLQKDQSKVDADDSSESSSTMSLGSQSLPDADSDANFVQPEPVKGKRGGRRKNAVVKVEDPTPAANEIGDKVQEEHSTLRRGKGQGRRSTAVNTPEKTASSSRNSRSSKTPQGTLSKSPRSSPKQLDPGSSPSLRRRSSELKPKVMFTGVIDKSGEKIVTALGGELVDSVFDCTHLVTDKVRRTVKFLCCLSRGALIVTPDWLEQSKLQQRFIDANDFMLSDKDAEKQHKFSLSKSIERANKGVLLSGWKVHTTPNVKPDPSQMKDIIKSAGGEILSRIPCQHQECTVVISCEADSSKCLPAVAADIPIVTAEFLLTGLLRQEINLEEYHLSMAAKSSPANSSKKSSTPASKTRSRRR